MKRRFLLLLTVLAVLLLAPPAHFGGNKAHAQAQSEQPAGTVRLAQSRRGVNLFDLLFGGSRTRRPRSRVTPPENIRPSDDAPWVTSGTPKDPGAKKVYVFGDAFAFGLAKGLESAFASTPTVEIVARVKPNSGIVRDDYYDWPAAITETLAAETMDFAVIMLGSNDRQQMRLADGTKVQARSEKWDAEYIKRVDDILNQFYEKSIPVYWVGLPIMQPESYGRDMAFLNEVFQARVQRAGGRFIDVWSRFADEEGRYSGTGPDVNGQIRRLRNSNGIHMTKTGNQKLAFFVEQELRDALQGGALLASFPGPGSEGASKRPKGPVEMEISLTRDISPAGADLLAGGEVAREKIVTPADEEAPDYKLLVLGESPKPQPGRADDFSWPSAEGGETAAEAAQPN